MQGDQQSGVVGAELAQPLVARVVDAQGRPIAGQSVTFHVTSGGGSVFSGSSVSNADGVVQERWTLGTSTAAADSQRLEARAVDTRTGEKLVFGVFRATALPDIPASISAARALQQGAAGAVLPESLVVAVRDRYGNPTPGVTVAWTAKDGGGTLGRASSATDSAGRTANIFTLGPRVGSVTVTASIPGHSANFTLTAVAAPAAHLAVAEGDGQTAPASENVPIAPAVQVTDRFGNPVAGFAVSFEVASGGGSVTGTPATTDPSGVATVAAWRLGPTVGANSLRAVAPGTDTATFTASAATSPTDLSVHITTPAAGVVIGNTLAVQASATSKFTLTSVKASAGSATADLAFLATRGTWSGTLDLSAVDRGAVDLTVVATDVNGTTAHDTRSIAIDRPPVVTVTAPNDGTVPDGPIHYAATCSDDDPAGCRTLTLALDGASIASGTSSLDGSIDANKVVSTSALTFTGTDSRGQQVAVTRTITRPGITPVPYASLSRGMIVDVRDGRVLAIDTTTGRPAIVIQTVATGATQTLDLDGTGNARLGRGFLTPHGAIVTVDRNVQPISEVFELRDGQLLDLGGLGSGTSLVAKGDYAIFVSTRTTLTLRDLAAGTNTVVATDAGNTDDDVAANGDVVYWNTGYDIMRYRQGTATAITNDPDATVWNTYVRTDGSGMVYLKGTPCCTAQTYSIAFNDAATETILTPRRSQQPQPDRDFAIAGGWVAFTSPGTNGLLDVWRRSAAGNVQEVAPTVGGSVIAALGDDGTVVITAGRQYLVPPGATVPTPINATIHGTTSRVIWRAGVFYSIQGTDVYAIAY